VAAEPAKLAHQTDLHCTLAQALLAEKAAIAAEHAELAHQNAALLARLELMEAGGMGVGLGFQHEAPYPHLLEDRSSPEAAAGAGEGGDPAVALAEELNFLQGLLQQCAPQAFSSQSRLLHALMSNDLLTRLPMAVRTLASEFHFR